MIELYIIWLHITATYDYISLQHLTATSHSNISLQHLTATSDNNTALQYPCTLRYSYFLIFSLYLLSWLATYATSHITLLNYRGQPQQRRGSSIAPHPGRWSLRLTRVIWGRQFSHPSIVSATTPVITRLVNCSLRHYACYNMQN